jgi:hypothetical protein
MHSGWLQHMVSRDVVIALICPPPVLIAFFSYLPLELKHPSVNEGIIDNYGSPNNAEDSNKRPAGKQLFSGRGKHAMWRAKDSESGPW